MTFGIEAQRIFRLNKHGMDFVILEEILELQQVDKINSYYIFVRPGEDRCIKDTFNFHVIEIDCPTYPLWEQYALPKAVKETGVEVLHCTSDTAPLFCKVPLVLTLHDIIYLEPREIKSASRYQNLGWFYRKYIVPRILKKCSKVITVSEYESDRIRRKFNFPKNKLQVVYNGYNERFHPLDDYNDICQKYIQDKGFFLFLGNTDPKKNTERTIVAYSKYLEKSNIKRKLLVADITEELLDNILQNNNISNIKDSIVLSGYIDNKELPYVYNGAFAFLYTSLRESFGIPLLEAMACGTPVVTSNTSSMPEIAGEKAIFVTPEDTDDISNKMMKLENDNALYNETKAYGIERAKFFSWKITAEGLRDVYQDIINDIKI